MASTSFSAPPPLPGVAEAPLRAVSDTHPALRSLHAASAAMAQLEACYSPPSSTARESPSERSLPTAPLTSRFLADAHERHWEALTKQLRLLLDATHPNVEVPAADALDDVFADKKADIQPDGRAVLVAWNAARPPLQNNTPAAGSSTSQEQPTAAPLGGEVTHLFHALQALAEAFARAGAAPASSASTNAAPVLSASEVPQRPIAARLPAATKAQLQVEDIVEPVLIYGCAVASNLASFVSGGRRGQRQSQSAGGRGSAAMASFTPISAWTPEERASVTTLGNAAWAFVLTVTRLYQADRRVLHLLLSVLSNMVSWPALTIDADESTFLYQLILPFYTSSAMVAAWVTMLCNLTAVHGHVAVPALLRLGVVADVQRLCLAVPPSESATTERLVEHSVQLLSNIAMYVFQEESREKRAA